MKKHLKQSAIFLFLSFITATVFAQTGGWSFGTNSAILTPTTANAAIGTTVNPKAKLLLNNTISATDTTFGLHSTLYNSNANLAKPLYGLYAKNTNLSRFASLYGAYIKNTQQGYSGYTSGLPLYGLYVDNEYNPFSGNVYGIYSKNTSSGYSSNMYGIYSDNALNTSFGGSAYGAYLLVNATGTSSYNNVYGLYSEVTGAHVTTRYAGYFTGGKVVVMNGDFGLGTETPSQKLHVVGKSYFTDNVGIGYSNPTVKLDVNGIIRAHEVKVCLTQGCDYVFEKDYKLMPLSELSTFVKTNKHLPEVAPAAEMESEGINLSEMNALLLKKIEELTLYIIEIEQRLSEVENK
ncbi:MAG: hypothetical protein FWC39_00930 [Bacteroidetes bacterium]|nr:hypothetical protein [Bacteroidota bacterium]